MRRRTFIRNIAIGTAVVPLASFEWLASSATSVEMAGFQGHVRHGLFNATVAHSGMKPIAGKWLFAISKNCFFRNGLDASNGEVLHHSLILGNADSKFLASCYSTPEGFQLELDEQCVESVDVHSMELEQDGFRWQLLELAELEKREFTPKGETVIMLVSGNAEVARQPLLSTEALHTRGDFSIRALEDTTVLMASLI